MSRLLVAQRALTVPGWAKDLLWRRARAIPSLDLRFANNKSLVDAVTGASLITFTRASSGTYVDSAGVLQTAAIDVPRFDHNPTTGESLGLLVEEPRTNLMTYSEQLNDAIWGPVGGTVTANAETSPANTLTADKLIATNGGPQGQLFQPATITSGATVTGSVYAKAGVFDRFELVLLASNNTTPYGRSVFNPNTGVITTAAFASNGGTNASSTIQALSNGWYRFSVTVTYPAVTSAGIRFTIFNADAANGDGVKGVFLWGAQLEAGAFPTSYIPTTTAAATRSADVASITGTAFSGWYRQDEGTVFADAINTAAPIGGAARRVFEVNNNSEAERLFAGFNSTTLAQILSQDDNVVQVNLTQTVPAPISNVKLSAAYRLNDTVFTANGSTVVSDTVCTIPTPTQLTIGYSTSGGNSTLNGHIRRLTFWPQALPSRLQALTQ